MTTNDRLSHALKAAVKSAESADRRMSDALIKSDHLRVLVGAVNNLRAQLAEAEARANEDRRRSFDAGMVCASCGSENLADYLDADDDEEIAVREQAWQAWLAYEAAREAGKE